MLKPVLDIPVKSPHWLARSVAVYMAVYRLQVFLIGITSMVIAPRKAVGGSPKVMLISSFWSG
jgi:hypothetical protein